MSSAETPKKDNLLRIMLYCDVVPFVYTIMFHIHRGVHVRVCMFAFACVYTCIRVYVCMCVCVYVCMCVRVFI